MGLFDDVLLTVDFDRTLTGNDATIPQRNLDAIRYFMDRGGRFTVNTGRSVASFWREIETIPVNAPFLLYNGSACYDRGTLRNLRLLDLPVWETIHTVRTLFPDMNLEIQGAQVHYLIDQKKSLTEMYDRMGWRYAIAANGQDMGPFIKFSLCGDPRTPHVRDLFTATAQELRRFDQVQAQLCSLFGDRVAVFRAAPRIIDVHAAGISKLKAARSLQRELGRKILVCVGDAPNDMTMLDGADYAFCPAQSLVADRYPNVCTCDEGAVADVIYEKIPEILLNQP